MINTAMKSKGEVDRNSLASINSIKVQGAMTAGNISTLNQPLYNTATPVTACRDLPIPPLTKQIRKGQKVPLESGTRLEKISACFGWNTLNHQCDVDVSAFLLDAGGKVPGDSWFVFYGQTKSPDGSCTFESDNGNDREIIHIDFNKLNSGISKIVFVLTINDAFAQKLNFSMLKDAYIRILQQDKSELASFKMSDYYDNVISMMIGEIYRHNGIWKFNAVGNGVARDLAGLCELYGVQVSS